MKTQGIKTAVDIWLSQQLPLLPLRAAEHRNWCEW